MSAPKGAKNGSGHLQKTRPECPECPVGAPFVFPHKMTGAPRCPEGDPWTFVQCPALSALGERGTGQLVERSTP